MQNHNVDVGERRQNQSFPTFSAEREKKNRNTYVCVHHRSGSVVVNKHKRRDRYAINVQCLR